MKPSPGTPIPYPQSDELRHRVYQFIRILNQSHLFGDQPFSQSKICQLLHMPGSLVHEALHRLHQEEALELEGENYRTITTPPASHERVLFFLNNDFFATPYAIYIDYLIGCVSQWEQHGWKTQVVHTHDHHGDIDKLLLSLVKGGVKGIVFAGNLPESQRKPLKKLKVPIRLIGNSTIYQSDFGVICSENFNGMVELVREILRKGHQKIAYFTAELHTHHGREDRLAAYEQVMRDASLPHSREFVFKETYRPTHASSVAEAILKKIDRPSVVICGSDREAFELISALKKGGAKVPSEIGITGFYNTILNLISDPPLTSVDIRGTTMGQLAAHHLLQEMDQPTTPLRIMVPTRLENRRSVLPLLGARSVTEQIARKTSVIRMDDDEDLIQF